MFLNKYFHGLAATIMRKELDLLFTFAPERFLFQVFRWIHTTTQLRYIHLPLKVRGTMWGHRLLCQTVQKSWVFFNPYSGLKLKSFKNYLKIRRKNLDLRRIKNFPSFNIQFPLNYPTPLSLLLSFVDLNLFSRVPSYQGTLILCFYFY